MGFFFFHKNASADTLYTCSNSETSGNATERWNDTDVGDHESRAFRFIPDATYNVDIVAPSLLRSAGATGNIYLVLTQGNGATSTAVATSAAISIDTLSTGAGGAEVEFTFTDLTLVEGTEYWFHTYTDDITAGKFYYQRFGDNTACGSSLNGWYKDQGIFKSLGGSWQYYLSIYGTLAGTQIEIVAPTDTYSGADFSLWSVEITDMDNSTNTKVYVGYNNDFTFTIFPIQDWDALPDGLSGDLSWSFRKNWELYATSSSRWYAKAWLVTDGSIVAESSIITFTINAPYASSTDPVFGHFGSNTPLTTDNLDFRCEDEDQNWVADSFCNLIVFLVVPKRSNLEAFKSIPELFEDQFPFNYAFEAYEALKHPATTSSTAGSITYTDTSLGLNNFVLFGTSTIRSLAGDTAIALFRTIMVYITYAGFAMHIFQRIKQLFSPTGTA